MEVKKPIYKKWWFWVGALVLVIIVANAAGGNKNSQPIAAATDTSKASASPAPAASAVPKSTETPKPTDTPKPVNKKSMSKAEFDQIQNGMTYEEVTAIIGGPGEVVSEVGDKGSDFYTVMYKYDGEGSLGANANLMFQGGKLNAKSQFGLS
jgi:hypothetical protein